MEEMILPDLPKGWERARLGDVMNLINGFAFKPLHWKNQGFPIIRIQNLNNPSAPFNYCSEQLPDKYRVKTGDLLFAWSGTPGTSFGAHIWKGCRAWLNQHIFKVEFNEDFLSKKFIQLAINQNLNDYINQAHGGAGLAHITKGKFESSLLSIPPIPEQHRIVAKIEELFSDLDAGVEALKKAKTQIKLYRQAVLKAAFEGRLTAEWRETNFAELEHPSTILEIIKEEKIKRSTGKIKKLLPINFSALPQLPKKWVWVKLDNISEKITDGTHFTPNYIEDGTPFISVKDIYDGQIHFDKCKYISKIDHANLIKRCHPEYLDILITKSGIIGRTAVIKIKKPFSLFVSVALIKPIKTLTNSYFINLALIEYVNKLDIKQSVKGGVIKNLHIEDLKEIIIPFPSLTEQEEIVKETENRFSIIDEIEKAIGDGLKKSGTLRQSILKKAFSGQLVPQDPEDEPAEVLLTRIREEKAKQLPVKKLKQKAIQRKLDYGQ
jgi:type I restriction enzyme, S subunit